MTQWRYPDDPADVVEPITQFRVTCNQCGSSNTEISVWTDVGYGYAGLWCKDCAAEEIGSKGD